MATALRASWPLSTGFRFSSSAFRKPAKLRRYSFKTRLGRLCRRAGVSRVFPPYALRHTFASMESDGGEETTSLSRLMGHTTTRTLERYVVNTAEHHLKGVTAVQDRIRSVVQQAAGDKTETKTTTEISEAKGPATS